MHTTLKINNYEFKLSTLNTAYQFKSEEKLTHEFAVYQNDKRILSLLITSEKANDFSDIFTKGDKSTLISQLRRCGASAKKIAERLDDRMSYDVSPSHFFTFKPDTKNPSLQSKEDHGNRSIMDCQL